MLYGNHVITGPSPLSYAIRTRKLRVFIQVIGKFLDIIYAGELAIKHFSLRFTQPTYKNNFAGVITSGIENQLANFMERWNTKIFATFMGKSIEMGAQTSIYCVVTNDNINGKYMADCREERLLVNRCFYDEELAKKMFEKTKRFLGLEKRD